MMAFGIAIGIGIETAHEKLDNEIDPDTDRKRAERYRTAPIRFIHLRFRALQKSSIDGRKRGYPPKRERARCRASQEAARSASERCTQASPQ